VLDPPATASLFSLHTPFNMATIPIPTLSTDGFVTDPVQKLNFLLSYFFTSRENQDYLFRNQVVGIQQLLAKGSYRPQACADLIQTHLSDILKMYFQSVRVSVAVDDSDKSGGSAATLNIMVEFTDTGVSKLSGWTYGLASSVFARVATINNNGQY
jgi:hypothetical protein